MSAATAKMARGTSRNIGHVSKLRPAVNGSSTLKPLSSAQGADGLCHPDRGLRRPFGVKQSYEAVYVLTGCTNKASDRGLVVAMISLISW